MFEFTKNELRDLVIAFIVLSIAFAIANVKFDLHAFISILPIVMFGVGVGFLLHELGHKYVANKYGYKAEFKLWPIGLLIALITSLIGWVFALPGEARSTQVPAEVGGGLRHSSGHVHMLLLKDEMNTDEAKKMAAVRHEYLEGFIEEFKAESDGKYDCF